MRKQKSGLISTISSVVGSVSTHVLGWYAASKHAVEGYTDALRLELKDTGINVVKIRPGALKTEFDKVAFDKLDNITYASDYKPLITSFRNFMGDMYKKCQGPERTADIIAEAINAKNPRVSYTTTNDAKMIMLMKRLFGERVFDNMIRRVIKNLSFKKKALPKKYYTLYTME